jgi:putative ABC transport system permease protein
MSIPFFDRDTWQEIFTTMGRHKTRTFLTALGVFWGIFILIVLLASGNGLRRGVEGDFANIATNSFFMWGQKTTKPFGGFQPGRFVRLNNQDTDALKQELKDAKFIAPRVQIEAPGKISRGTRNGTFSVYGDYPDLMNIEPKPMLYGRFVNDDDIVDRRKVAVIGRQVSKALFGDDVNPVGQYIQVKGIYFQVVGMFRSNSSGEQGLNDEKTVYMPFTTVQQVFNLGQTVFWYSITAKDGVPASVIQEQAIKLIKARKKIHPEDVAAIGSFNLDTEFKKFTGLFDGIQLFMWMVGIGTLIAGIMGVSNIMVITVQERTKEFGVRKAIGALNGSIISLVIQEAVFLTAVSGYFGLLAAVGLTEGINALIGDGEGGFIRNPTVDLPVALAALGMLIFTGTFAGLLPAMRAAAIQPIEALRAD